ncbi:transcriptional regulator GcvA [Usitatibacter palustris]|uniref:Glycine cleavage system transcriptional activator n=1 Tax=Usitatibacter palustris TaxID=2732487 RepID=A0A6M4H3B5_9PROT|nr:transcriptional regulator GcvA [Usitatibacter palustris]QJR14069.1 Glycine cleavage system transcriptional activator [Usitatibacter palustris]
MDKTSRSLPPLDLLPGFEAAARHLSFTKAAEELFLTQSAVSRQILALEEFLGVQLFERRHRALALTEAGQAYLRTVAPVLDHVREATRRLREPRTGHVLTVTTTLSFAATWLVPRLARFRKEHPRVDVRIAASGDVLDMAREGIDVAIRDIPQGHEPAGSIPLAGEHVAPICSAEYFEEARAAKRPLAKPEDLRHHVLIHVHDPTGKWPWIAWETWMESSGLEPFTTAGTLTFGQYDQVVQAALLGQGIAMGRMTLVSDHVRRKQLVVLFGKRQRLARAYHAIYAPGAAARPEAQQFVSWVRAEIASRE